jgi:hypothetical protein
LCQYDDAFEGICSIRDIEMAVKPLSNEEIKNNMKDLKKKLMVFFLIIIFLVKIYNYTSQKN